MTKKALIKILEEFKWKKEKEGVSIITYTKRKATIILMNECVSYSESDEKGNLITFDCTYESLKIVRGISLVCDLNIGYAGGLL